MNKIAYLAERVRKVSDRLADINLQLELDDIYDELRKLGERRNGGTAANTRPPPCEERECDIMDDFGLAHAQAMIDTKEPRESAAIY